MSYEILVGLNVIDDTMYEQYRAAMKPILASYEGSFGYDFVVSEVLITQDNPDINRVFTITFSDESKLDGFFSDPEYVKVKERYFESSVKSGTIISRYEKHTEQ